VRRRHRLIFERPRLARRRGAPYSVLAGIRTRCVRSQADWRTVRFRTDRRNGLWQAFRRRAGLAVPRRISAFNSCYYCSAALRGICASAPARTSAQLGRLAHRACSEQRPRLAGCTAMYYFEPLPHDAACWSFSSANGNRTRQRCSIRRRSRQLRCAGKRPRPHMQQCCAHPARGAGACKP
jgi:hypothetical protein